MGRKNIYDLLEENEFSPSREYARLRYLFCNDGSSSHEMFIDKSTLYHRTKTILFKKLPIKRTCIDLNDLLDELGINLNKQNASLDDLFNLIEFILCVADTDDAGYMYLYKDILNNIKIIVDKTSHKIIKTSQGRIVIPNDAKVEQAATIANDPFISLELLKYNHRSNIGNLENKKKLLNAIGQKYEVKLKKDNGTLSNSIRFLLNKLDIRHDNINGDDKVVKLVQDDLEYWYDNLYTLLVSYIIKIEDDKIIDEIKGMQLQVKKR